MSLCIPTAEPCLAVVSTPGEWGLTFPPPFMGPHGILGPKWGSPPFPSKFQVSGTHSPIGTLLAKRAGVVQARQEVVAGAGGSSLQTQCPHRWPGRQGAVYTRSSASQVQFRCSRASQLGWPIA